LVLNRLFASLFASSHRYCNEHLLCPPHVFWTGWGPWERCTAQCGGGIQARRRTCENGPDCPGCSVVSNSPFSRYLWPYAITVPVSVGHLCMSVCSTPNMSHQSVFVSVLLVCTEIHTVCQSELHVIQLFDSTI